ncbi:alcohol dehydrogenase [Pokkaliibacter plantistimulans]|uniref:Alcohol dehydrogenase n=1 Tax=Proteobacteria bacterium 228 TaxID=2083153 RepID=A0A2S5KMM9_9PROT|nr:cytochrome c [Pokkaliibacter plantistimulans]PPC75566.1 alcohol dehydrogenase [Pokkaliibacter plantistimulans]
MADNKTLLKGAGALVLLAAAVTAGMVWKTFDTGRSAVADDQTPLSQVRITDPETIRRGEYVMRLGDCAACHSAGQGEFAGGYEIATPFGTLLSSNITPDSDTGIGKMTERQFFNAVRQGIGSHGLLYPAMPYTAYAKFSDQDMHDLWAYMSTLPAVRHRVDENAGMAFPYNIRLAMAGWDMLFFDNNAFTADPGQSDEWNRGKYIVDGGGHCSVCHSPRNALGAEKTAEYLQGGSLGEWYAPDITSNPHTGIGSSSVDDLMRYLHTGSDGQAVAAGPMAEAVEHSTQYFSEADRRAVATYLKTVAASAGVRREPMPLSDADISRAALSYEVNCSACHGLKGEGIEGMIPAFAGNRSIQSDDATNLIHAMLKGTRAAHTETAQTAAGMPSFAWKMNDQQVALILNYVRNNWGNGAKPVTATEVAALRHSLKAREQLQPVTAQ